MIKAGMELRIHHPESLSLGSDAWGNFNFTGAFTGYDVGDFLWVYLTPLPSRGIGTSS